MPLEEFVDGVRDVLVRADSLFGTAPLESPIAHSHAELSDAADSLRRSAGSDMSGSAIIGYGAFAQRRAAALAQLADTEASLNQVLKDAAGAENTAASTSRSTVEAAAAHSANLNGASDTAGGQRALIAALHAEVGRQQDLVGRHQQRAGELAEQVRLLSYE